LVDDILAALVAAHISSSVFILVPYSVHSVDMVSSHIYDESRRKRGEEHGVLVWDHKWR
jgi:hypothetical protein